jgi:hypothetical protein
LGGAGKSNLPAPAPAPPPCEVAPASPATEEAAFTSDVGQRGDPKIKVKGIGGDGGEYKDETRLKELFEKMNLQVDQAKVRERVNEKGVDASYAIVTFHQAPDADAAMRSFESGDLPNSFTVEQFDMQIAANSRGAMLGMYEGSPTIVEDDPDDNDYEFHSHDIFEILNDDVEEHFYGEEVINPKCKTCLLYAINPTDPHRLKWDAMMLVMVVYSSMKVAYTLAFRFGADRDWDDTLISMLFYSDIVLNFFTGYSKGYIQIMTKSRIVRRYLQTYFFVDVLATVDWTAVVSALRDEPGDPPLTIQMLGLFRLVRLFRLGQIIDLLTVEWWRRYLVEAAEFFVYTGVVAHVLACTFYMWPFLMDEDMFTECAEDASISQKVHACIDHGNCEDDQSPKDGVGWFWKGQCMQSSWRQATGYESICFPGLCSPHEAGGPFDLAYDTTNYIAIHECPSSTGHGNGWGPIPMSTAEETELLLKCLNTAENDLDSSDSEYAKCPLCMRPGRLYLAGALITRCSWT